MTDLREDKCQSCGVPITWVVSKNGKPMPLNLPPEKRVILFCPRDGATVTGVVKDTYVSHYADCPQASSWRGRKRSSAPGQ